MGLVVTRPGTIPDHSHHIKHQAGKLHHRNSCNPHQHSPLPFDIRTGNLPYSTCQARSTMSHRRVKNIDYDDDDYYDEEEEGYEDAGGDGISTHSPSTVLLLTLRRSQPRGPGADETGHSTRPRSFGS